MTVTEQTRTEVAVASDYFCALVHPRFGRCSASAAVEMHHVVYRSQGGSDDPDNLLALCPRHHSQIHEGRMWRVDAGGRLFFGEGHGEDYVEWSVWPEVRDEVEAEYEAHRAGLEFAGAMLDGGALAWCWHLWQIDQRALWQAGGWSSLIEFVQSIRDVQPSTVNNHLRVAKTYFEHLGFTLDELSSIREIQGPDGKPRLVAASYADLREAAPLAQSLSPESRDDLLGYLATQPVGQLKAAIQDEVEEQRRQQARERGVDRVEMTGTGEFSFVLTMDSKGDEEADEAEFRRRVAGITKSIAVAGGLSYKTVSRLVVNPA